MKICPLCRGDVGSGFEAYVGAVCRACAGRAVNSSGEPPLHQSNFDAGDNPVFIGRYQCWRRYRFGGFVTMFDPWDTSDIVEFYELSGFSSRASSRDDAFARLLAEPPSAVAAGLHADELTHNRALHSIIGSMVGPGFVRALCVRTLAACPHATGRATDALHRVASASELRVSAKYQPAMKLRRADEFVEAWSPEGTVGLIIEMKVEAEEDLGQLRDYLGAHGGKGDGRALAGIMLVLGLRAVEVFDDLVVVGAEELQAALADSVDAKTPVRLRSAVNDYRRSVGFLSLRDEHALHPQAREAMAGGADDPIRRWEKEEWRWIQRRIAREIRGHFAANLPAFACRVSNNDDPTGTSVDLWLRGDSLDLKRGTSVFAKWRIGTGFAIHAGAWDLGTAAPDEIRQMRARFRPALRAALSPAGAPAESNKPGKSGAIVALADTSQDWVHIARRLRDLAGQAIVAMAAAGA